MKLGHQPSKTLGTATPPPKPSSSEKAERLIKGKKVEQAFGNFSLSGIGDTTALKQHSGPKLLERMCPEQRKGLYIRGLSFRPLSPWEAAWKPCTKAGTLSVKKRWRNMSRTSAWPARVSTSVQSDMSREKPSAAAGPSSGSLRRPVSCRKEVHQKRRMNLKYSRGG